MSKVIYLAAVSVFALLASGQLPAQVAGFKEDHYLLHEDCTTLLNEQIGWELHASIVYLNMAAYFDRPSVGRLGYAKFFREQSLEEYGHAGKIIDYINSRNSSVRRISIEESPRSEWSSASDALHDSIILEKLVYAKLQHIHDVADQKCQDSHLMDFLETDYFSEQVDSIKELQLMLTTLDRDSGSSSMIEYMTDLRLRKSKKEDL